MMSGKKCRHLNGALGSTTGRYFFSQQALILSLFATEPGGVGSLAVQLAKARGASVIGTASGRNEEFVRDLGADGSIEYDMLM